MAIFPPKKIKNIELQNIRVLNYYYELMSFNTLTSQSQTYFLNDATQSRVFIAFKKKKKHHDMQVWTVVTQTVPAKNCS